MIVALVKNIYTIIASFLLNSYHPARNVIPTIIAMVALPFSSYELEYVFVNTIFYFYIFCNIGIFLVLLH